MLQKICDNKSYADMTMGIGTNILDILMFVKKLLLMLLKIVQCQLLTLKKKLAKKLLKIHKWAGGEFARTAEKLMLCL